MGLLDLVGLGNGKDRYILPDVTIKECIVWDDFNPEASGFVPVAKSIKDYMLIEHMGHVEFLVKGFDEQHGNNFDWCFTQIQISVSRAGTPEGNFKGIGVTIYHNAKFGVYAMKRAWKDDDGQETARLRIIGQADKLMAYIVNLIS